MQGLQSAFRIREMMSFPRSGAGGPRGDIPVEVSGTEYLLQVFGPFQVGHHLLHQDVLHLAAQGRGRERVHQPDEPRLQWGRGRTAAQKHAEQLTLPFSAFITAVSK